MNPRFMQIAIDLAQKGIHQGHGPFGAVIVCGEEVIASGTNRVTSSFDPTAHAEICAIRNACKNRKNFALYGCEIYTTCEPCPMCLGAIYWSRLDKIYYGSTRADAAAINFDDHHFYEEIKKSPASRALPMLQMLRDECMQIFSEWVRYDNKIAY